MLPPNSAHYLLGLKLQRDKIGSFSEYPLNLSVVSYAESIAFHPKVTFLVGENGSGKSTLLEAIATAWGFNPEGGTRNFHFSTRSSHSNLSEYVRLVRGFKRPRDGFFLRAESFYNVASNIDQLDEEPGGPPIINSYGKKSLHMQSHGESFFSLMQHRFGENSIYILDEPEAAVSPTRQLEMLAIIHRLANEKCQFIIATHSPIIMAYPDSYIYLITPREVKRVSYKETDHYRISRRFLMDTDNYLESILGNQPNSA